MNEPPAHVVTPKGIPTIVVMIIPRSRAPFTFLARRIPVTTRPIIATPAGPLYHVALSSTSVAPPTMIPAFWSPMKAMNRPIPAAIAFLRLAGMLLTIASLTLQNVRRRKMIPSTRIADSAH